MFHLAPPFPASIARVGCEMQTPDLFASTLREIADSRHVSSDFQSLTKALLTRLAEKGVTLEQCSGPLMLDRPLATLKSHCTKFGIRFPDFTPPNMRTQLKFIRSGDFMELTGEFVGPVASVLGIVSAKRDGKASCAVPVHAWDDAKVTLRNAGYEARKGATPKRAKAVAHA